MRITIWQLGKVELITRFRVSTGVGDRDGALQLAGCVLALEDHRLDVAIFDLLVEGAVGYLDNIAGARAATTLRKKLEEIPANQQHNNYNDRADKQGGAITRAARVATAPSVIGSLWSPRSRVVRVVLKHIYSLSVHWFRPAFFVCRGFHRECS